MSKDRVKSILGGKFTPKQLAFVEAMEENPDGIEAAKRAGVKASSAGMMAHKWMHLPHVAAEVKKRLLRKMQLAAYSVDQCLTLIQQGAFMCAPIWFEPGNKDYTWLIEEEAFNNLPHEILRHVVSAVKEKEYDEDGNQSYTGKLEIRLTAKEELIKLCARHMLIDQSGLGTTKIQINWNQLLAVQNQAVIGQPVADGQISPPQAIEDRQSQIILPNQAQTDKTVTAESTTGSAAQAISVQITPAVVDQSYLEAKLLALVESVNRELMAKSGQNQAQVDQANVQSG